MDIKKLINEIDKYLARAYSKMNENEINEEYFINLFWDMIEYIIKKIIKYIHIKLKPYKITIPEIVNLLYDDKDEERIKKYFLDFKNTKNKIKFLQRLSLIFHTEAMIVLNNLFLCAAEEVEIELDGDGEIWVHLFSPDGSECGAFEEGDYYWQDVEPYCDHPGCDCYLNDVWIELKDIDKIDLVED